MKASVIAFTEKGCKLGRRISEELEGKFSPGTGADKVSLSGWIEDSWKNSDLLVFVSSTGIAVRTIAPYIVHKAKDPGVIVIDDNAKHCISLLSGHIGRANEYTDIISRLTGADAVITTATDVNGVFSIDSWATENEMIIINTERIKDISKRSLNGECIDIEKEALISIYKEKTDKLILVPRVLSVGIGCRRNTEPEALSSFYFETFENLNIYPEAVKSISTIDLKKNEEAILKLVEANKLRLNIYTADELNELEGEFSGSEFVRKTVGTDSVCERSAVLGNSGKLLLKKTSKDGMTIAIAIKE
ncbi:MAG: cobalt-precorrin 5A hydrolase [Clostridiales bacterium]|jgi:cobalt-precorrin 5A hydrolase|nr:cobalt-precorrin 5A hydrolase [Clostridiales bacterium]